MWVAFALDFLVRLALAERRWRFIRANWLDLLTLAVPMLRPLRAPRVVVALNILGRRGEAFARGRVVGSVVAVVGLVAALAVLDAERGHHDANIQTFGDALWWAATTVTTVGYGHSFPITAEGRLVDGPHGHRHRPPRRDHRRAGVVVRGQVVRALRAEIQALRREGPAAQGGPAFRVSRRSQQSVRPQSMRSLIDTLAPGISGSPAQ